MQLTVVGCSGSFPGPDSPASCYLLEHDGHRLVLDMGNGSLGALQQVTDIYGIDAVVLSHLHVDHFIDLCSYYVALKYRPGGQQNQRVPVWGPPDTATRLVSAYGLTSSDMAGELDVRTIMPTFEVGPFRISTRRMRHPVESNAIRVEAGGRSVTYSGDTGPTDELVQFAAGTDVALFEASFLSDADNPRDLHLTGPEAAALADRAGAGRVILTHLVPWHPVEQVLAEAQRVRPDVIAARQGLIVEI